MTYIKAFAALGFLALLVFGYVHEMPYFSNTFEIQYLFFRALSVGLIVGGVAAWRLSREFEDSLDRVRVVLATLILAALVFPVFAVWSNHTFASKNDLHTEGVIFERSMPIISGRFGISKNQAIQADGFYTYFLKNNEEERVRSKLPLFQNIERGTAVELPLTRGFWGFDFY